MRKPIIAGNWKMNKNIVESAELVNELKPLVAAVEDVDVVVCPSFVSLVPVAVVLKDSNVSLGAQNMWYEESGAYTGEVSASMLTSAGCQYVILGHSERRDILKESDELINQKVHKALEAGLTPILCVGEQLKEREAGTTEEVVKTQLEGSLEGLTQEQMAETVIAYEPVWAIGTGKTATPEQAQEVHAFIRNWIKEQFGANVASSVRIQYGGSVKGDNAAELMGKPDIDGALVGGASLQAGSFSQIVMAASLQHS